MTDLSVSTRRSRGALGGHATGDDGKRRQRAFRAARRHTLLVRLLKLVLPASGIALAVVALLPTVVPKIDLGPIQIDKIELSGDALTMERPRLTGFDKQQRAYEVLARQARQNITNPKVIALDQIDARLQLDQSGFATLDAGSGLFDSEKETLILQNKVVVRSTTGYEAFLDAAQIDLKGGLVTSDEPVEVKTGAGNVKAKGLEIRNKGETIVFRNGVKMTVVPSGAKESAQ
ncbi:MAG: LPS export ABC transporter periplasmic protein LptC [Hyphomicrobiales bacterium]